MRTPLFWEEKTTLSTALLPFSLIYGFIAGRRRAAAKPQKLPARIICVGNLVAGGAGKTPVALALAALLKARGANVHFLTRGYKGRLTGPLQVNPAIHNAHEVGDEPLLLARQLPTWMAKDRVAGAQAAIAAGAEIIIMDDGFQNTALHKDVSLLVIDGHHGVGNGRLLPAGPLRESPAAAMKRAQAVVLLGEDAHNVLRHVPAEKTIFRAQMKAVNVPDAIRERPLVAFAGIARPRKFYRTLQRLGCTIRKMVAYSDHHVYTAADLEYLRAKAKLWDAALVTTTKDYVRLPQEMRAEVIAVEVEVVFENDAALVAMMLP